MLPILLKLWMFYKLKCFNILVGYSPRGTAVSVRVGGQLGSKNWRNILHIFGHSNRYTNIGISFIAVACCHKWRSLNISESPTLLCQEPHPLLWDSSRVAHGKITLRGRHVPNHIITVCVLYYTHNLQIWPQTAYYNLVGRVLETHGFSWLIFRF